MAACDAFCRSTRTFPTEAPPICAPSPRK
jgi:hypothetical protein